MNDDPELVETETVEPEAELVVYEEPARDLRGADSEEQLAKVVQEHIVNDFEKALNLIRSYQTLCKRVLAPDLHWQEAHDLLAKYRMESVEPSIRIYDPEYGDITTHTTSIKGEAEEIEAEEIEETSRIEVYDDGSDPNFAYHVTIKPDLEPRDESSELVETVYHDEELADRAAAHTDEEVEVYGRGDDAVEAMHKRREGRPNPEPERPDEAELEWMRAEGYVDCPICEGTGRATKGVLKGRTCSRCGGYGLWRQPETAELVADEDGNFGLRPTGLDEGDASPGGDEISE